ncbi:MAG: hypothetical protein P4K86_09215 [Terracidiphilus sp.]|nr:hypothetical protein [Terracidiphilus sp.]MDR3777099.1 hypothetical protein [Terracidiphilus sp.]
MKRFGWILVILLMASPAWAAKKVTVQQLKDMLVSMQQAKKADADVASELKQIELSEELTRSAMNSLIDYVPGPYSTEQIYVLEARSAVLAPPASDLPSTPAPDAAGQKVLLDKAADYVAKTYKQLPSLTATKTTLRFQDNMEAMAASSGMHSSAKEMSSNPALVVASQFVHYINSTETPVETENGVEKLSTAKDKTPWGANAQIALQAPGPVLSTVLDEAQGAGKINWLRWETVNGKQTAVFAFAVDKKKSHYTVNYCCFPDSDQTGTVRFTGQNGAGAPGGASGSGGGAKGNLQTTTNWKNYKATVPYHGELFIDQDTGIVVRLISEAEFKPSEVVHQEDQRIDYGPVKVGDKMLVLPVKTVINTEVVPNGDSGAGKFSTRHTLFTSEYKNYQPAGAAH